MAKIRKDSGLLTHDDFDYAPIWEFCFDEEGIEGQDEGTVRPVHPSGAFDVRKNMAIVAIDFQSSSGRRWLGSALPTVPFRGPWNDELGIMLPAAVTTSIDQSHMRDYNSVLIADGSCVRLSLPWESHVSWADVRVSMDLAYQALGVDPGRLFPLTCRPRAAVKDWPREIVLEGFIKPVDRGGEVFEFIR